MRKTIGLAHRWLGLVFGGLLTIIGLTGALLVFYVDIDAALHPELHDRSHLSASSSPNWDQAIAKLRQTYPDKTGPWRLEVTPDGALIPARYNDPRERAGHGFAPMLVWLSADGRHVLRQSYWGDTAMTWVYNLHYQLLSGNTGGVLVGLLGMIMMMALGLGLVLWWPRGHWAKALRYKQGAAPTRQLRDQHKLIGLAAFLPLALLGLTGAMLALPSPTAALLGAFGAPPAASVRPVSDQHIGTQIPVHQAIAIGRRYWPTGKLAWIEVPGRDNGVFVLRIQLPGDPSRRFPRSYIWVDQYRGTIVGAQDVRTLGSGAALLSWLHPLHDGSAGGIWLRLIICLSGITPLALWWTGRCRARLRAAHARNSACKRAESTIRLLG